MKKLIPIFLMCISVLILFITNFNTINAFSSPIGNSFGGMVTATVATEITQAESEGYSCIVGGETVTINPFGLYARSYFIPYSVSSKTRIQLTTKALILGLYSRATVPITCTMPNGAEKIINLPSITLFGNSY